MLLKRLITALFLIPIVVYLVLQTSPMIFLLCIVSILMLGASEWLNMFNVKKVTRIFYLAVMTITVLCFPLLINYQHIILSIASFTWLVIFLLVLMYNKNPNNYFVRLLKTNPSGKIIALILGYVMLVSFGLGVYLLKVSARADLIIVALLMVWSIDSGAYFAGKLLGGKKLIAKVSPSKTWTGAAGGFLALLILCIFLNNYYDFHFDKAGALSLFLAIVYVFAVFGDLAESMFKRIMNVKDSGYLLPGHGGVLDRIDSFISLIPIYCLIIENLKIF